MADIEKLFGRLVSFVLLVIFIWRVVLSGQLLLERKISSSVSKQYSKWRLFPSLTICFGVKNIYKKGLLENIDGNLRRLLNKVVLSLRHRNVTESGFEMASGIIKWSRLFQGKLFQEGWINQQKGSHWTCGSPIVDTKFMYYLWSTWSHHKIIWWGKIYIMDIMY